MPTKSSSVPAVQPEKQYQPRYDETRRVYRDCKWCQGNGCLACQGEAEKAYKAEFPDGPKPIATFERSDTAGLAGFLKDIVGEKAAATIATALRKDEQ
jgi:hypothetical protein